MNLAAISRPAVTLLALLALQPAWGQEPVVDPPARVARVGHVEGKVSLATQDSATEDGTEEWRDAVLNRPLTSGDKVWVDGDGRAELQIGSSNVYLDRDTTFGFIELDDDVLQMSLTGGTATLRVNRMGERETIQVETPNSTVRVRHPGEYHFEVDPKGDRTIVKTRNGEAEVVGRLDTYQVRSNEQGVFTGLDNLTAQIGGLAPRTAFESWANDRERENEDSRSARYVSRDVIGYEDLDDHGDWISEPEYGYVWRPRYVAYDWAPYRYGHWAHVGPWGWTWIDDARWGFAPFHYGRWAYLRSRWCWVPGPRHLRPVYAPALVGWVGGPGVSVSVAFGTGVGWFPLGPREIYVPGYRHTPRYIRYVNVTNTVVVHDHYLWDIDRGRYRNWNYRHRQHPYALTFVPRDRFLGGRPVGDHRVRMEQGQLVELRDNVRPPHKEMGDFRTVRRGLESGGMAGSGQSGSNSSGSNSFAPRNNPVGDKRDRIESLRALESRSASVDDRSRSFEPRSSSGARRRESGGSSEYRPAASSGSSDLRSEPSRSFQPRSGPIKSSPSHSQRSYSQPSYSQPSFSGGSSSRPTKRDHMERPPKQWSAPSSSSHGSSPRSSNSGNYDRGNSSHSRGSSNSGFSRSDSGGGKGGSSNSGARSRSSPQSQKK